MYKIYFFCTICRLNSEFYCLCCMFIAYSVYHNQDGIMCTSLQQKKELNLQALKGRYKINAVILKHGLEERVSLEERNGIFPIWKLWYYMMC